MVCACVGMTVCIIHRHTYTMNDHFQFSRTSILQLLIGLSRGLVVVWSLQKSECQRYKLEKVNCNIRFMYVGYMVYVLCVLYVRTVYTVSAVYTVCTVCTVCAVCTVCTVCTVYTACTSSSMALYQSRWFQCLNCQVKPLQLFTVPNESCHLYCHRESSCPLGLSMGQLGYRCVYFVLSDC